MRSAHFVLGVLFCMPLLAQGQKFLGDEYVEAALEECQKEVGVSVNKTAAAFRNLASTVTKLLGSGTVVKPRVKHDPRKLHFSLVFPSESAAKLAQAREVCICVLERVMTKLHNNTTPSTDDPCDIDVDDRKQCGSDTTKYKCQQRGCCFDRRSEAGFNCYFHREVRAQKMAKAISPEMIELISSKCGCVSYEQPNCSDWCFHRKYRTIDGTCNNRRNPLWGAILTPMTRFLPAMYEDGLNTAAGWTTGRKWNGFPLPSAREVSQKILSAPTVDIDTSLSYMVMQWSQFVNHDVDLAPTNPSGEGFNSKKPCSNNCENDMPCFPIPISRDDKRVKDVKCFGFTRSASLCTGSSILSPREQMNEITVFLDGSSVYGSTKKDNGILRDPYHPEFLVWGEELYPGKFYLPVDNTEEFVQCEIDPKRHADSPCFRAGDKRVNEQIGLTMMHTVFHREHNRIAAKLKQINPHWGPETVYQEARKILGAEFQVISYEKWLPRVLGDEGMKLMGKYHGYDPKVDPTAGVAFISAAFRFGHLMVIPEMPRLGKDFKPIPEGNKPLHLCFFAPFLVREEGGIDPLIRGFLNTGMKKIMSGKLMNTEITDKLFKLAHKVALDLGALNIQRGRDHGVPPYTHWRDFCGLKEANTFDDLAGEISNKDVRDKLEEVYGHVDNVDLFTGGASEDAVGNGVLGPTFMCIVAEQFRRIRDGDRLYYANPSVFTPSQLATLRNTTLARILCDNGDNITEVQPDAFQKVDYPDGYSQCDDYHAIPAVDLGQWEEESAGSCPSTKQCGPIERAKSQITICYPKMCCCGTVYGSEKNPICPVHYRCCADKAYDPEKDTCCNGILYCGKPESKFKCCKKLPFDPKAENCIEGKIHTRGDTSCHICGDKPYDPETHICCGKGKLYKGGPGVQCCRGLAYNTKTHACCLGSTCYRAVYDRFNATSCSPSVKGMY